MVTACGHGTRQRKRMDSYGFPRGKAFPKEKTHYGFQTGDIVKAVVTKGKKAGAHVGRVAVRSTGRFNIKTASGTVKASAGRSAPSCRGRTATHTALRCRTAFIPQASLMGFLRRIYDTD